MSHQNFSDESNYKHRPTTDHHVNDKYGKGTHTRNWKKNLDEHIEDTESVEASSTHSEDDQDEAGSDRNSLSDPDATNAPG